MNPEFLVDGKYSFKDLVDIDRLRRMFESFSQATNFTTALISYPDQELLISTGFRDICSTFHRAFPASEAQCKVSNKELTEHLKEIGELNFRCCTSGLVDGATPIIIRGIHVANLSTGQIFFKQPDLAWFRKQGETYGYDVEAYLVALAKVPVVTEEAFKNALKFLSEMAVMLAEQGLANLQNRDILQTVRESAEHLRITLNSIGDAVIATDDKGKVTTMNPVAETLTGWVAKEAHGKDLREIFPIINAKTREVTANPIAKVLALGKIVGLANHTILISKNGTEYQIADSAAPIMDHNRHVSGVVLVFRDVTEKYQMEVALQESETRLSMALAVGAAGVWEWDLDNNEVHFDAQFHAMLGYTPGELPTTLQGWLPYHYPADVPIWQSKANAFFKGEIPIYESEHRIRSKAGIWEWVFTRGKFSETTSAGAPHKFIGIAINISERKRIEAELLKMQKLTSVGTLAGGIAHDFNNILMGLFGNIALAKNELFHDHPSFKPLEEAEKSMGRAIRLTKQLLTFAKGGEPVKEDVSLGTLAEEVARFDLSGSNVLLVHKQAADLWIAKADKGQIQQVISNLTINAREAMPNGGHLYITLENVELRSGDLPHLRPGKYIRISIQDEGIGIDPKTLERIFDPYFTTKHTGSGLGLATSFSIIHKHGGHIDVASELGKGTTFTLYLPASESPSFIPNQPILAPPPTFPTAPKILILDDEDVIRMVIPRWLRRWGCLVETTADGRQAIDLYQQSLKNGAPFDVMILDLTIPGGIGGQEVLKEVLAMEPSAKAIVSSGYAEGSVMSNFAFYGFKGVLAKPYTEEQLQEVLRQVLLHPKEVYAP